MWDEISRVFHELEIEPGDRADRAAVDVIAARR